MRGAGAFVGSIFASALLLFLVEPMVAKMALPRFGGGPAVWSTCLVFFQVLLLAGYAWSHFSVKWLGVRGQMIAHLVVLAAPLVTLPPVLRVAGSGTPVGQLLFALTIAVGLPFLALAANGSLVQRWFAVSEQRDPYFLYAASNAGSLVALVAYPFAVEPLVGLRAQGRAWAIGYGLFAIVTGAAMLRAWRASDGNANANGNGYGYDNGHGHPLQKARWVFRSTVGSLLLMAVSTRISTDVAAVPLLWVLPLAIYLATFIVAFWPRAPRPGLRVRLACKLLLVFGLGLGPWWTGGPLWWVMALPLAALAIGAWVCHADLAGDRPPPERLTEFYLWVSVGGALGGLAGALVAPRLFSSIGEYPIALALLALVLSAGDGGAALAQRMRRPGAWIGIASSALLLVAGAVGMRHAPTDGIELYCHALPLITLLAALSLAAFFPEQLVAAAALVAVATLLGAYTNVQVLAAERGFFGVLRIHQSHGVRSLVHGTTVHGSQQVDPPSKRPSAYYHPSSPLASALASEPKDARIAVVGLGAGALAALCGPEQRLTYYEIDPAVEPMARRWFTYLAESRGRVEVVLGDARLELARAAPSSYHLIVLDAFSSDAIPVHLLTVDALAMYLDKLEPGGVVLLHISNRYLDLAPLLGAEAARLSVAAAIARHGPTEAERKEGATPSTVVAIARDRATLDRLGARFVPLAPGRGSEVWTDDRSSLLRVLVGH